MSTGEGLPTNPDSHWPTDRTISNAKRLSNDAALCLQLAKQEADRMQSATIETVHLLIGIIKHGGDDSQLLTEAGINLRQLREYLKKRTTPLRLAKLATEVCCKWQVEPYYRTDFTETNQPIIGYDESAADAHKEVEEKEEPPPIIE